MRGDTAAGGRAVHLHHGSAFGDEAVTVEELADRIESDVEDTMFALLALGAQGKAETDLHRWRLTMIEK